MKLISVRSPYFIEIDEVGQTESKIELFIWHKGEIEPTLPTYTLSKKASSISNTKNIYNISNFAKEYINIINPVYDEPIAEEENSNWCFVKLKRYYKTDEWNLIDEETLIVINGYTNYLSGYNRSRNTDFVVLNNYTHQTEIIKYYRNQDAIEHNIIQYLTVYINFKFDENKYTVRYYNLRKDYYQEVDILVDNISNVYFMKIPITISDEFLEEGNYISIFNNDVLAIEFLAIPVCENKYRPVVCSYINLNGVWDTITFFKARTEQFDVKNKEYQLLPSNLDYNIRQGEIKSFNYEAKSTVKLNTGWIDESYNIYIKDLLCSETILLDNIPVKLKTLSTDIKSSLQDKMINYTVEFEYNYNQIQNVI